MADNDLPSGFTLDNQPAPAIDQSQAAAAPADSSLPSGFKLDDPIAQTFENTTGQKIGATAEGLARGLVGPFAPAVETALSNIPGLEELRPEEQAARQQANPIKAGIAEGVGIAAPALVTLGGSLAERIGLEGIAGAAKAAQAYEGYTQAGVFSQAAKAAFLDASTLTGKIGIAGLRGAGELWAYHASDEFSKVMMGEENAQDAVASALGSEGLKAAGLGLVAGGAFGALGAGFEKIAAAKKGAGLNQGIQDFGKVWKDELTHPDLAASVHDELNTFYGMVSSGLDNEFGTVQLKDDAIKALVPTSNDAIAAQKDRIGQLLQNKISKMAGDPDSYPPRLIKILQTEANNWMEAATNPEATSFADFKNTEGLKQKMQYLAKFGKSINPLAPEGPFVNDIKDIGYQLRTALEDQDVWGKAGELQKESNAAYSKIISKGGPMDVFEKRFVTNNGQGDIVNPAAINTYVNQLGKPSLGVKSDVIQNFAKAGDDFLQTLNNIHAKVGLESPIPPISLAATKSTYGDATTGGNLAKYMFRQGIPAITGKMVPAALGILGGAEVGGAGGAAAGGLGSFLLSGQIGKFLENTIGHPVTNAARKWMVPTLLKAAGAGPIPDIIGAIDHAGDVNAGITKIGQAIKNVFENQGAKAFHGEISDKDRERVKKYITSGGINNLIQGQMNQQNRNHPNQKPMNPMQTFAHGGEVKRQPIVQETESQPANNPLFAGTQGIAQAFPTQNTLLQAAKGRISNYLTQAQPSSPIGKLPYDHDPPGAAKQKSYDRAVDLSLQPLNILNHVKDGSITPELMQHFTSMFPELHGHLSKKLMERISQTQVDEEKPNYKTRQGMAMFMGSPLDSSQTPQSIQSIQAMYAGNRQQAAQQAQAQSKSKKNTSKMDKLSTNLQTPDQARTARANA